MFLPIPEARFLPLSMLRVQMARTCHLGGKLLNIFLMFPRKGCLLHAEKEGFTLVDLTFVPRVDFSIFGGERGLDVGRFVFRFLLPPPVPTTSTARRCRGRCRRRGGCGSTSTSSSTCACSTGASRRPQMAPARIEKRSSDSVPAASCWDSRPRCKLAEAGGTEMAVDCSWGVSLVCH